MALKSNLFRADPRLEACRVNNAKHITTGAQGSHVEKIQFAVMMLDGVRIAGIEVERGVYGPSTAQAVLAYKTKRRIINPAYQTKADNIVGIMTITRLDQEMLLSEARDRMAAIKT